MKLGLSQELRSCRERSAIHQDVHRPVECWRTGLLKTKIRMFKRVYFGISSEFRRVFRDSDAVVIFCVIWKVAETPFVDNQVVVIHERPINQVGEEYLSKFVLSPAVPPNVKDQRFGTLGLDGFKCPFHELLAGFHRRTEGRIGQSGDLSFIDKLQVCKALGWLIEGEQPLRHLDQISRLQTGCLDPLRYVASEPCYDNLIRCSQSEQCYEIRAE